MHILTTPRISGPTFQVLLQNSVPLLVRPCQWFPVPGAPLRRSGFSPDTATTERSRGGCRFCLLGAWDRDRGGIEMDRRVRDDRHGIELNHTARSNRSF